MNPAAIDRKGLAITAGTFFLWGVVPLYWHLLKAVPSLQIIAHRIVWSAVLVLGWLLLKNGPSWWRQISAQPRALPLLGISSLLIAFNWGLYIWAVNAGHVVETSLGYFINPLINVVLGVLVLRERLSPAQWVAVAFALLGVAWLTLQSGSPPWIALGLAFSFGLYGLVRKLISVDPVAGLGVESAYLVLPALAFVVWGELGHGGGFVHGFGWKNDLLLVFGGVVTAVPLIGFAYGVRRIPLSIVGLLQYIAPTIQLLIGVLVFKEAFGPERMIGFAAIWLGLLIFASDGLWRSRNRVVVPAA
ncbi:EamA family transporter RarD [Pseudoxanthomonas sp. SL93]|jgi:chloramphenicol-sensitive protein RarD|uniref:EamA family transporter RarD n=1 Tax=Pseudoxanthomonas sp. SL93 TaxID=2995142 RepID=UPI002270AC9B|nr:EamA family transporter RarD [Pseudoxanthomonas sp. SL93]WAC62028.1 EamA family transporter RarD [Pseudoxanthomonas sp. SL93]